MQLKLFLLLLSVGACVLHSEAAVKFRGVNEAGLEFGYDTNAKGKVGVAGTDYFVPTTSSLQFFLQKNFNTFRLPFRWERMQLSLGGALNTGYLAYVKNLVTYATSRAAYVILDCHNYALYTNRSAVNMGNLTKEHFANLWSRLATEFKSNPLVIFGLMNEPMREPQITTEKWLQAVNTAIAAIRATGATQLVLVPGLGWTGASSWNLNWYGTPNSVGMLNVTDPGNNYAYEVHQYLDFDSSGSHPECVSVDYGVTKVTSFTNWLKLHNRRGFLGEIGASSQTLCLQSLNATLAFLSANPSVWLGWTYWAAGPRWGSYMFNVEPYQGSAQLAILQKN